MYVGKSRSLISPPSSVAAGSSEAGLSDPCSPATSLSNLSNPGQNAEKLAKKRMKSMSANMSPLPFQAIRM